MSTLTDPGQDERPRVASAMTDLRPERTLARVDRAATAAGGASDEAGLARAFVVGSLIGFVVVFVLFGGLTLAAGMGIGAALGVGSFTAFWGGPGFGGMMGAVLHHSRVEST